MAEIKVGDRVRIKDRTGWVSPPGYRLANSEGKVIKIWEPGHAVFQGFLEVQIGKTEADINTGTALTFRAEALEKL